MQYNTSEVKQMCLDEKDCGGIPGGTDCGIGGHFMTCAEFQTLNNLQRNVLKLCQTEEAKVIDRFKEQAGAELIKKVWAHFDFEFRGRRNENRDLVDHINKCMTARDVVYYEWILPAMNKCGRWILDLEEPDLKRFAADPIGAEKVAERFMELISHDYDTWLVWLEGETDGLEQAVRPHWVFGFNRVKL